MSYPRLRRALLTAACATSLLLAACGGSGEDIVSRFNPSRVVAFGDAFSDAGMVNGKRYTINQGSNWTQQLASRYGLSLSATSAGGNSYAVGNARVATHPDAAGNAATKTVAEQVDDFLAAGGPLSGDLVVLSGGVSDIIAEARAAIVGPSLGDPTTNVRAAASALAVQVTRLVNAGAKHVVLVGPYNLGRSPWAAASGQTGLLTTLSGEFNKQLKIDLAQYDARRVLYVDAELYFNLASGVDHLAYGYVDVETPTCISVDATEGIGIGRGEVNSANCDESTLNGNVAAGTAMFADKVYFTPTANANFGSYAYDRIREVF